LYVALVTSVDSFRILHQQVEGKTVVTTLQDDTGLRINHRLSADIQGLTHQSKTAFENNSSPPVRLELLTSFSLSGITSYVIDDAPCRLRAHRFRSSC
jgi:alpha-galactosidase